MSETVWREALEMKVKGLEEELEKSRTLVKTVLTGKEEQRKEHEVQKEKLTDSYQRRLDEETRRWMDKFTETTLRQGQLVERLDYLIDAAKARLGIIPASSTSPQRHYCKSCGQEVREP